MQLLLWQLFGSDTMMWTRTKRLCGGVHRNVTLQIELTLFFGRWLLEWFWDNGSAFGRGLFCLHTSASLDHVPLQCPLVQHRHLRLSSKESSTMKAAFHRPPFALSGAVRSLTRSTTTANASQPAAPSSSTQNPHAARLAAASTSNSTASAGEARARLAKLQAQRLEELNRGRTGGPSGGRPNKPEQRWSNRTLIALATSVGACTYLMGTYHGYNAGKAHAQEEQVLDGSSGAIGGSSGTVSPPPASGTVAAVPATPVQTSAVTSLISTALSQLIPFHSLRSSIQCEPQQPTSDCHLAQLTQYHCDLRTNHVVCQPIDRIFRL